MIQIIFYIVFVMLLYMTIGFILGKTHKVTVSHGKSMSALLLYVLGPAMIINSFLNLEYTRDNLVRISTYFLVTLLAQILFFCVLYLIFHKKYRDSKYRIMSIGGVLGNVGFVGMPIIAAVFPEEPIVLCYSSINVMAMNLIVFTIGTYMITNDRKYISIKSAIWNPTTLSILAAIPIFVFGIHFPEEIENAIGLMAKMVTPMCMFVLGMRLSECDLRKIFTRKFVYMSCLLKLIVFPVFAWGLLKIFPVGDDVFRKTVVILAMAPSGALIESLAELYECEQEFAANVVLITTVLCVVTIPFMTFILI